jgi:hypothetical protein
MEGIEPLALGHVEQLRILLDQHDHNCLQMVSNKLPNIRQFIAKNLVIIVKCLFGSGLKQEFLLKSRVKLANCLLIAGHEFGRYQTQISMVKVLFAIGMNGLIRWTDLLKKKIQIFTLIKP